MPVMVCLPSLAGQPIIAAMPAEMDARALAESLTGQQIPTVTDRVNTVLGIAGDDVFVGTGRSPEGQPVPAAWVQGGLDRLREAGEIEISVPSLGHRSSFIGAILLKLPGAVLVPATPPGSSSPIPSPPTGSPKQATSTPGGRAIRGSGSGSRSPTGPTSGLTCTVRNATPPAAPRPGTHSSGRSHPATSSSTTACLSARSPPGRAPRARSARPFAPVIFWLGEELGAPR
jgi:hypothetical protein